MTLREKATGRYAHCYCWQGYDREWHEYSSCCDCGRWRRDGVDIKPAEVPLVTYNGSGSIVWDRRAP